MLFTFKWRNINEESKTPVQDINCFISGIKSHIMCVMFHWCFAFNSVYAVGTYYNYPHEMYIMQVIYSNYIYRMSKAAYVSISNIYVSYMLYAQVQLCRIYLLAGFFFKGFCVAKYLNWFKYKSYFATVSVNTYKN